MKTCARCFNETSEDYVMDRKLTGQRTFKSWKCPKCGSYTFLRGEKK